MLVTTVEMVPARDTQYSMYLLSFVNLLASLAPSLACSARSLMAFAFSRARRSAASAP